MKRRDFIKYGVGGIATLVVGTKMPWVMDNPAYAAVQTQTLNFTITDAVKEMVTHEPANNIATCYFWIYKSNAPNFPADCPGPQIYTTVGDIINISITNALDEDHAFFIPGMYNSGPIAPGATVTGTFSAEQSGQLSLLRQPECPGEPGHGAARRLYRHAPKLQGTRAGGTSVDPLRLAHAQCPETVRRLRLGPLVAGTGLGTG